jgi:hypothetical protein
VAPVTLKVFSNETLVATFQIGVRWQLFTFDTVGNQTGETVIRFESSSIENESTLPSNLSTTDPLVPRLAGEQNPDAVAVGPLRISLPP